MSWRNAGVAAGRRELGAHVNVAFLRDGRESKCASVLLGDLPCQSMLEYGEEKGSDAYPTPFVNQQCKSVLSVGREQVIGERCRALKKK